jgi:hypothetical protein
MVLTAKLSSSLNSDNIFTLLNNTDQRVISPYIPADFAELFFCDIKTLATELHSLFDKAKYLN